MSIEFSTLKPCLLISLKSSLTGNVRYARQDTQFDTITEDGKKVAKWETERVIEDPAEHEAAVKVRGKARSLITSVCVKSSFGLVCPRDKAAVFDVALAEARALVAEFNRTARLTTVGIYVLAGQIASDDAEAVRAINSEVSDLLTEMQAGIKEMNVETIREAANKIRGLGAMLSPAAANVVQDAISVARAEARRLTQEGEKAAEPTALTVAKIANARTMFLDLEPAEDVAAPDVAGRVVDLAAAE